LLKLQRTKSERPYLKNKLKGKKKKKKAGVCAIVVEFLPSELEVLSSNSRNYKKQKNKNT
jgi:hypothetical protein